MRKEAQLQLSRNIVLNRWTQDRNQPAFTLNKRGDHQVRTCLPFKSHACIGLCSAAGKELVTRFQLAEVEDKLSGAGEMVGAPALISAGIASNGAAEEENPCWCWHRGTDY